MKHHSLRPVRLSFRVLQGHGDGFVRSLRRRRPETRGTYQRALREFIRWFGRDRRCRFLVRDVQRYKRHLTRSRRLSAVSVSTYLTALRRFCDYLVGIGVLQENPAVHVPGNTRPRMHTRDVLTTEDAERLLDLLTIGDERGLRDAAIVRLMLRCGLSDAEVSRANVCDRAVQEDVPVLAVQGKGKATKDATVPLPPDVQEALDRYLSLRGPATPTDPLFVSAGNSSRGRRMTTRAVRDRVNFYLERAGIRGTRNVTPRSLRHTAALLMAQAGVSAEEIRRRLRLGTLQTTRVYLPQSH